MTEISWLVPLAAFFTVSVFVLLIVRMFVSDAASRLRDRLQAITQENDEGAAGSLIREKYLRGLMPFERRLEQLPGMVRLGRLVEQAGYAFPAYRLVLAAIVLAAAAAIITLALAGHPGLAVLAAVFGAGLPLVQIVQLSHQRLQRFEEQLPDALDMMARALRAGNPLVETFKFVADEMDDPIAREMGTTWTHLNYGVSLKAGLTDMIERMPSTSLRALATAILVQRETGGNLAEILDKLSGVLRARFRFQRRLRTLTAEGRMSAWVLILMPFALALMMSITSPDYLPLLTGNATGRTLIYGALILIAIGVVWIRHVVRIRL